MSNNNDDPLITCLYLGVVHDWGDNQIRVSIDKILDTGCDVSAGLGQGERKGRRTEEVFTITYFAFKYLPGKPTDGSRGLAV